MMLSMTSVLWVVVLCAAIQWLVSEKLLRARRRLPPGPTPLPIIGNLLNLTAKPHKALAELAKIHGPLMFLRFGFKETVVVSSAEVAREVLQTKDPHLSNRTVPDGVHAQHVAEYSITMIPVGDRWRTLRKIASTLVLHFDTSLNLFTNTLFSMDIADPNSELSREFKEVSWCIARDLGKTNLVDLFPIFKGIDLQGIRRLMNTHFKKDIFIAESETISNTLEWAMAELLHGPNKLKAAQEELGRVIGRGNFVREKDFTRLPYLQAVLNETLSLHPAVPFLLPRKAISNIDVHGFKVPKDSQMLVNVWAIGRDPSIWKNPNAFEPERFLDSAIDAKGNHFELLPFGGGRRLCVGLPLATRMMPLILENLINLFEWKLEEGMDTHSMNMDDKFGISLQKLTPLYAIPVGVTL